MLKIRPEQQKTFDDIAYEKFVVETAAKLKMAIPDYTVNLTEEELKAKVMLGIESAECYEIVNNYDIRRYIETQLQIGGEFHIKEEMQNILLDNDLDSSIKMDKIEEYIHFN